MGTPARRPTPAAGPATSAYGLLTLRNLTLTSFDGARRFWVASAGDCVEIEAVRAAYRPQQHHQRGAAGGGGSSRLDPALLSWRAAAGPQLAQLQRTLQELAPLHPPEGG